MNIQQIFSKKPSTKQRYIEIIDKLPIDDVQKSMLLMSWLNYLFLMEKKARCGWFMNNVIQISIIVLSLIVPIIEVAKLKAITGGLTIISLLSFTIALLTGINKQFSFDSKWRHYRKNTELARNEGDDYFALSGRYKEFTDHKHAYQFFMTMVTAIRRQELSSYFEWQQTGNKQPNQRGSREIKSSK